MVDVYVKLIIKKKRKFSAIPKNMRAAVEARLLELGYDTNGDPIETEPEE